ncbi:hypothetical protein RhiirA5_427158 [Rhizophagus irregularis]|uniref:Uncharacterized protein n=1 Tax=Rhizophagus irregularis TaxID=588596 RepID=A0A2N0P2U3_9GLOM|nr:hypothetical protein RhiirA5_427158 [Rhizophagus irregularis]
MLATSNTKFHIRLLPSRWYCTNVLEPYLVADKYIYKIKTSENFLVSYLCQERMDFREENLTAFEQKVYKKALNKALQNKSNSQQLIDLLQDFTEDDNDKQ